MRSTIARPDASEHAPYYGTYIAAAAATDLAEAGRLAAEPKETG